MEEPDRRTEEQLLFHRTQQEKLRGEGSGLLPSPLQQFISPYPSPCTPHFPVTAIPYRLPSLDHQLPISVILTLIGGDFSRFLSQGLLLHLVNLCNSHIGQDWRLSWEGGGSSYSKHQLCLLHRSERLKKI